MKVVEVSAKIIDVNGKFNTLSGSVTFDKSMNVKKVCCDSSSIGYDPKIKKILHDMAEKAMECFS